MNQRETKSQTVPTGGKGQARNNRQYEKSDAEEQIFICRSVSSRRDDQLISGAE